MKKDFQKKKLNLHKKTIQYLTKWDSLTIHGGQTVTCPTQVTCYCESGPGPCGTMTPATKCIGGTVPLSTCNTLGTK